MELHHHAPLLMPQLFSYKRLGTRRLRRLQRLSKTSAISRSSWAPPTKQHLALAIPAQIVEDLPDMTRMIFDAELDLDRSKVKFQNPAPPDLPITSTLAIPGPPPSVPPSYQPGRLCSRLSCRRL